MTGIVLHSSLGALVDLEVRESQFQSSGSLVS
jgi:hypothetical protein